MRYTVNGQGFDNAKDAMERAADDLRSAPPRTTVWIQDWQRDAAYPASNYCQRSGMPQIRYGLQAI